MNLSLFWIARQTKVLGAALITVRKDDPRREHRGRDPWMGWAPAAFAHTLHVAVRA